MKHLSDREHWISDQVRRFINRNPRQKVRMSHKNHTVLTTSFNNIVNRKSVQKRPE